ncbi:MAG: metallophosphoesterase [Clostridia bacterium]|nr:metallophosphoesterase [Clostridia bacterium]
MKIGLFTDAHYCNKEVTCTTRRPLLSYDKIKEAMEFFDGADLVICLGDLVDDCGGKEDNIQAIKSISRLIHSYNKPFYCLMGNHDCQNFTKEEFDEFTDGSYPPFSLCVGENALVFLDANYTDDQLNYLPGKVDWSISYIPHNQLADLESILSDEEIKNVYIFCHQNLETDVQWQHIVRNAAELRQLIEKSHKVKKVIQGHYHPGHDMEIAGIEYHTLPAMCEGEKNYYEILEIG